MDETPEERLRPTSGQRGTCADFPAAATPGFRRHASGLVRSADRKAR